MNELIDAVRRAPAACRAGAGHARDPEWIDPPIATLLYAARAHARGRVHLDGRTHAEQGAWLREILSHRWNAPNPTCRNAAYVQVWRVPDAVRAAIQEIAQ